MLEPTPASAAQASGARSATPEPTPEARALRARLACVKIWSIIGAIAIAAVVLGVLGKISSVIAFLATGCLVAYVASPLVNWMERHHVPRGLAAILGVIVVACGVVLLFVLVIPLFFSQMTDLLSDLPSRIASMGRWFASLQADHELVQWANQYVDVAELVKTLQDALSKLVTSLLSQIGNGILPTVSNFASAVFTVFLGLVLAYWIACDYPRINDEVCLALGPKRAGEYRLVLAVVSRSVGGYLRSTVIDSVIQGTLAGIGFMLAGHPYAGIMGVLSGVLNFVPVVGPSISAAIATLVALFYSPVMAFWSMIAAMVAQNVTDNLIVPKINQSTMQIHPVLSLTALMIGSALLGTVGMIVAIPLCAMAKSLFVFYFESRTGTQLVSYDGALFKGAPFHDAAGNPVPACDALGDGDFAADSALIQPGEMPRATPEPCPANPWEDRVRELIHQAEDVVGSVGKDAQGDKDAPAPAGPAADKDAPAPAADKDAPAAADAPAPADAASDDQTRQ